jgi:hypothetical protein
VQRRQNGGVVAIGQIVAVVVAGLRPWVITGAQALMLPEDDAADVVAQLFGERRQRASADVCDRRPVLAFEEGTAVAVCAADDQPAVQERVTARAQADEVVRGPPGRGLAASWPPRSAGR